MDMDFMGRTIRWLQEEITRLSISDKNSIFWIQMGIGSDMVRYGYLELELSTPDQNSIEAGTSSWMPYRRSCPITKESQRYS